MMVRRVFGGHNAVDIDCSVLVLKFVEVGLRLMRCVCLCVCLLGSDV